MVAFLYLWQAVCDRHQSTDFELGPSPSTTKKVTQFALARHHHHQRIARPGSDRGGPVHGKQSYYYLILRAPQKKVPHEEEEKKGIDRLPHQEEEEEEELIHTTTTTTRGPCACTHPEKRGRVLRQRRHSTLSKDHGQVHLSARRLLEVGDHLVQLLQHAQLDRVVGTFLRECRGVGVDRALLVDPEPPVVPPRREEHHGCGLADAGSFD